MAGGSGTSPSLPAGRSFGSPCELSSHEHIEGATVFVVDDDAAVRDSIVELTASVGLRAEGYASALDFLARFQSERPGCLVLDVRMAEMSALVLQQ